MSDVKVGVCYKVVGMYLMQLMKVDNEILFM